MFKPSGPTFTLGGRWFLIIALVYVVGVAVLDKGDGDDEVGVEAGVVEANDDKVWARDKVEDEDTASIDEEYEGGCCICWG